MSEPGGGTRASLPRALIALVQVLGLAVWFSATAVGPALRAEWGLGPTTAVWLTCAVQLGFVAGALGAAVCTLADRMRPHRLLALSAAGASVCTLLCTVADGAATAIVLRGLTGMFLAGVYPVGMKLMTSWSRPERRARDLGTLVAALTLGSALPHLVLAGTADLAWREVLAVASGTGLLAAAVAALFVRPGPGAAPAPPPDRRYAVRLLREPGSRLVVLGYLGHMWELYALWTWLGSYLGSGPLAFRAELLVFLTAGLGGALGCLAGGRAADRWGRVPTVVTALLVSGACCLLSPFAVAGPPVALGLFCLVWATAAVADSPVLTTATIEVADPRYTGTALTVQTALGFALTVASIQLVPLVAGVTGWAAALAVLAVGPFAGAVAMVRMGRLPATSGGAAAAGVRSGVAASGGAAASSAVRSDAAAWGAAASQAPGPEKTGRPVSGVAVSGVAASARASATGMTSRPVSVGAGGAVTTGAVTTGAPVAAPGPSMRPVGGSVPPGRTAGTGQRTGPADGQPSPRGVTVAPDQDDTVELYRLRRRGAPVGERGFAGDAARALRPTGRPGTAEPWDAALSRRRPAAPGPAGRADHDRHD